MNINIQVDKSLFGGGGGNSVSTGVTNGNNLNLPITNGGGVTPLININGGMGPQGSMNNANSELMSRLNSGVPMPTSSLMQ
jgi:hypothetical protein